jgi:hypothetical protein
MPTKMSARQATTTRRVQPKWVRDDLKLPGLAEALEAYRRIAGVGGSHEESARVQIPNPPRPTA